MGHRISSLPTVQYCARSPEFDTGSGRAAVMSTAWHARCAGAKGSAALLASLTSEEAETVLGWSEPDGVALPPGCEPKELLYEHAETELEVLLKDHDGTTISVGHLDMAWVVTMPDGMRVAYVGDLKKSEFTTPDSYNSLQLHGYGFAYAALRGCDAYVCGIWAGEEGRWTWSPDVIDLESDEAFEWWQRVKAAALNTDPEFRRGPHCRGCWSRFQCPAHILPPEAAVGSLAIATGQELVTPEKVAQLVLDIARAEDTIKTAKAFAKDWEANHPGKVELNGKVWRAVRMPGRAGLDKEGLLKEFPAAKKYVTRGANYEQMKWVNAK